MNIIKQWAHKESHSQPQDGQDEDITDWVTVPHPIPPNPRCSFSSPAGRSPGVQLVMFPDPAAPSTVPLYKPTRGSIGETSSHGVPWCARVEINVEDMPALRDLMKHRLDLSSRGIKITDERALPCTNWGVYSPGWTHFRQCCLTSTAADEPKWTGLLKIYTRTAEDQHRFHISRLSVENVRYVYAWDEQYTQVYCYDPVLREKNHNDVYEAMPADGWWPWATWWPRDGSGVSTDGCK